MINQKVFSYDFYVLLTLVSGVRDDWRQDNGRRQKKLAGNCSYGNSQPTISLFYPFGLLLYEAAPAERIFSFTILDAGDELVEFQTLRSALCRNAEFV